MHCLRWVTVAELGCGRAWGAVIQHQGPEEYKSDINTFKVDVKYKNPHVSKPAGDHLYNTASQLYRQYTISGSWNFGDRTIFMTLVS